MSLFTVSVFCTVTVSPRVPRAGEVGTPLGTLWRGDSASAPALPRVTLNPYGPVGGERIPMDPRGMEWIPMGLRGTEWVMANSGTRDPP